MARRATPAEPATGSAAEAPGGGGGFGAHRRVEAGVGGGGPANLPAVASAPGAGRIDREADIVETVCTHDGFWRGGARHFKAATRFPLARFTAEELARIEAEPRLTVRRVRDAASGEEAPDQVRGGAEPTDREGQNR